MLKPNLISSFMLRTCTDRYDCVGVGMGFMSTRVKTHTDNKSLLGVERTPWRQTERLQERGCCFQSGGGSQTIEIGLFVIQKHKQIYEMSL